MYSYQLFEVAGGFGYEISNGGVPVIHQEFHPDLPGDQLMDEATAREQAEIVFGRLSVG